MSTPADREVQSLRRRIERLEKAAARQPVRAAQVQSKEYTSVWLPFIGGTPGPLDIGACVGGNSNGCALIDADSWPNLTNIRGFQPLGVIRDVDPTAGEVEVVTGGLLTIAGFGLTAGRPYTWPSLVDEGTPETPNIQPNFPAGTLVELAASGGLQNTLGWAVSTDTLMVSVNYQPETFLTSSNATEQWQRRLGLTYPGSSGGVQARKYGPVSEQDAAILDLTGTIFASGNVSPVDDFSTNRARPGMFWFVTLDGDTAGYRRYVWFDGHKFRRTPALAVTDWIKHPIELTSWEDVLDISGMGAVADISKTDDSTVISSSSSFLVPTGVRYVWATLVGGGGAAAENASLGVAPARYVGTTSGGTTNDLIDGSDRIFRYERPYGCGGAGGVSLYFIDIGHVSDGSFGITATIGAAGTVGIDELDREGGQTTIKIGSATIGLAYGGKGTSGGVVSATTQLDGGIGGYGDRIGIAYATGDARSVCLHSWRGGDGASVFRAAQAQPSRPGYGWLIGGLDAYGRGGIPQVLSADTAVAATAGAVRFDWVTP